MVDYPPGGSGAYVTVEIYIIYSDGTSDNVDIGLNWFSPFTTELQFQYSYNAKTRILLVEVFDIQNNKITEKSITIPANKTINLNLYGITNMPTASGTPFFADYDDAYLGNPVPKGYLGLEYSTNSIEVPISTIQTNLENNLNQMKVPKSDFSVAQYGGNIPKRITIGSNIIGGFETVNQFESDFQKFITTSERLTLSTEIATYTGKIVNHNFNRNIKGKNVNLGIEFQEII